MLTDKHITDQFQCWLPDLQRYLSSILKDHHVAEEIASTAFLRTWERRGQFANPDDFKAYMFIVGRNAAYEINRKVSGERKRLKRATVFAEKSLPIVEARFEKQHLDAWMKSATEQLPPRCREIFKLLYYHGMKTEEVAIKLNISTFTVKSQRGFAINKLKALAKKSSEIFVHIHSNEHVLPFSDRILLITRWAA